MCMTGDQISAEDSVSARLCAPCLQSKEAEAEHFYRFEVSP